MHPALNIGSINYLLDILLRRVSYSTEKHRPSHENSGYLGGADGLIDGE